LRSERSLIQTIGRAARHIHGKAILYAGQMTHSMQAAINETNRRRIKQQHYNQLHKISPKSIKSAIKDIMEKVHTAPVSSKNILSNKQIEYTGNQSPKKMMQEIERLEKQMYRYAENLEFEQAAKCRDQVKFLQNLLKSL